MYENSPRVKGVGLGKEVYAPSDTEFPTLGAVGLTVAEKERQQCRRC